MSSSAVWDRVGQQHALSKNLYAFLVCFWTMFGIGVSAVAASFTTGMELGWGAFIGAFVMSLVGVFVSLGSDNPIISLMGYMMIAVPFGLILGPIVALYTTASVAKVFFVTTAMVGVLGVVGAVIPDSLESWGGPLLAALTVLIVGQFAAIIAAFFGLPVQGAMTMLDWIGVFIFGAYVVFDLNRAMRLERTHDNAIDSAVAIYLDFYNLFIRLLSIMGDTDDD